MLTLVLLLQFIFLIRAISNSVRTSRLKALTNADYPSVPPDELEKWKTLELRSNRIFLWGTLGTLFVALPIMFVLLKCFSGPYHMIELVAGYIVLWLLLFTLSGVSGSKAARMKKRYGIKWPKK